MNKALHPEDMPRLFVEGWNQRRPDLMAALFEDDADFVNVVGLWWQNRADIFKAHDYGLRVIFPESVLRITRLKTKRLSDDIAVMLVRLQLTGQTAPTGTAGTRHNMFTFVVRRQPEGHWLCAAAQNTDIVAGAETYVRQEDGSLHPVDYRPK